MDWAVEKIVGVVPLHAAVEQRAPLRHSRAGQMYFCKSYGGQEEGAFVWKDVGDAGVEDDVGEYAQGPGAPEEQISG